MDPQIRRASNWYRWLWFSPLLTVPTAVAVAIAVYFALSVAFKYGVFGAVFSDVAALLISAIWHLVLLIPAFGDSREFVRWHGRQALLLAAVRTAMPIFFCLLYFYLSNANAVILFAFIAQIAVWSVGTLWGQGQAARGDCALMRWAGHGSGLPLQPTTAAAEPPPTRGVPQNAEALVDLISQSHDPQRRRAVLAELERHGWVETL